MVVINSIWNFDEMPKLADDLSDVSLKEYKKDSEETGKFLCTKLANTISRLAHTAKMQQEDFKRLVVKAIREYVGEIEGIRKYESRPGNEGKYMRHIMASVGDMLNAVRLKP